MVIQQNCIHVKWPIRDKKKTLKSYIWVNSSQWLDNTHLVQKLLPPMELKGDKDSSKLLKTGILRRELDQSWCGWGKQVLMSRLDTEWSSLCWATTPHNVIRQGLILIFPKGLETKVWGNACGCMMLMPCLSYSFIRGMSACYVDR